MKHTSKHNAGFTLVELIVAMAIAVVVTAAATSVLLLGLRVNRQTADTASQQMTVRSLLKVMEGAAADGNISNVESDIGIEGTEEEYGSWVLKDKDGKAIFCYDAGDQIIYTNEIAVLNGVYASNAIMEGQLLSISIETKEGVYTSSIYCRMADYVGRQEAPSIGADAGTVRGKFIEILKSQYRSRGTIWVKEEGKEPYDSGKYYSEWYVSFTGGYEANPGWNTKTPWCACYISWALSQPGVAEYLTAPKDNWYANVDDFKEYFVKNDMWKVRASFRPENAKQELVGNIVFFDWDRGTDPEHVGVVIDVKMVGSGNAVIYTIEGNSAGRVTVRSYSLEDPRIIGYGVLPWTN